MKSERMFVNASQSKMDQQQMQRGSDWLNDSLTPALWLRPLRSAPLEFPLGRSGTLTAERYRCHGSHYLKPGLEFLCQTMKKALGFTEVEGLITQKVVLASVQHILAQVLGF